MSLFRRLVAARGGRRASLLGLLATVATVATAIVLPSVSQAAAGDLATQVTPLSDAVTYARPASGRTPALATYVAWRVTVTNRGTNTINAVRVRATASITSGPAAVPRPSSFEGIDAAACTTTATGFDCALGTVRAGGSTSFIAFFAAPGDPGAPSVTALAGQTIYAEGQNDSPSSPNNSVVAWPDTALGDPPTTVALGTANPTLVRSAVPRAGGTLFTGTGVGTPVDPLATTVVIPPSPVSTTARIAVAPTTAACTSFLSCLRTDVTVPGLYSPYLTFVLRQNAANIRAGTKIGSVLIWYEGATYTGFIGQCASPTTPNYNPVTGVSIPCIAGTTHYRNRGVPGWTPELDGSFEFRIIAVENGGFTMF